MAGRPNFTLRGATYHFRRRVPDDLRALLRRRELVRSLLTGQAQAARMRAARLYVASEGLFQALRTAPMLDAAQLARLVQDFYGLILDGEDRGRLVPGRILAPEVRALRVTQYETTAARARDALACNRREEAGAVTDLMLRKQGIARWAVRCCASQDAR